MVGCEDFPTQWQVFAMLLSYYDIGEMRQEDDDLST
jgi:hypothetical protein